MNGKTGATVFRRYGPAWRFEQSEPNSRHLYHRTTRDSVYVLVIDDTADKPIYVGRYVDEVCVDVTSRIGAYLIQFDGAGEYWVE